MLLDLTKTPHSSVRQGEYVFPYYGEGSFANIPSSIVSYLTTGHAGVFQEVFDAAKVSCQKKKVLLFLVDGFGYTQFLRYAASYPLISSLISSGAVTKASAVFPSTTAAALSTIHTGLTPLEHGLPEWLVYFDEVEELVETLPFRIQKSSKSGVLKGRSGSMLLSSETIYEKLAYYGIPSFVLDDAAHKGTTYSSVACRGSTGLPYKDVGELFAKLATHAEEAPAPSYSYVYWGGIDAVAHDFGPHSLEYKNALSAYFGHFEEFLKQMSETTARETTLIVTADHGQVLVDPEQAIYLNEFPFVRKNLATKANGQKIAPWGSARDVFIRTRPGMAHHVANFLKDTLGERTMVLETREALARGLFGHGTPHPRFLDRIGDLLVIPSGKNIVWYEHVAGQKYDMLGIHGGLHEDEMLVPFAVAQAIALK